MVEEDKVNQVNIPALIKKLKESFTAEEIAYLLNGTDEQKAAILENLSYKAETPKDSPSSKDTGSTEVEKLIKENLLSTQYHVFQWIDVTVQRDSIDQDFKEPFFDPKRDRKFSHNGGYALIPIDEAESEKRFLSGESYGNSPLEFKTSKDEKAKLGHALIIEDKKKVLIHGGFSTESFSTRIGGRMNTDNQIIFTFKDNASANKFYNLFAEGPYTGNPTKVEQNIGIIEKAMSSVLNQQNFEYLQARLLLGLEVKKIKRK